MEAAIVPVAPLIIILIWVLRSAGKGSSATGLGGIRLARGPAIDAWLVLAIVVRASTVASLMIPIAGLTSEPPEYAWPIAMLAAQATILFPSAFIDRVLVPLGLVRTTFWFSRTLCPLRSIGDPLAGAVIDASRALRACGGDRAKLAHALGFERLTWRGPIDSQWSLLAWAELADAAGDKPRARQLFEAADLRQGWAWIRARRRARLWLTGDAAERGDWERVVALGVTAPRCHPSRLLARAAEVLLHRVERRRASMVLRWLATPSRRALFPWVMKALAWRRTAPAERIESPPSGDELLRDTLRLHARVVAAGASATWAELADLARAWEGVTSPATEAALGRRIAVLGARIAPGAACAAMLAEAREDLVGILGTIAEPMPSGMAEPPLLRSLRHEACDARLATLESLVARLFERPTSVWRTPASPDAWISWGAVRTAYDGLARLSTSQEITWVLQRAWSPLCNHAAWACNDCGERALAHDIFAWLHRECARLKVPADMKLLQNNSRLTR